jgi:hypothetical protein
VNRLQLEPVSERSLNSTIEIAAELLQVGDRESEAALRQLLATNWPGRRALHNAVAARLADAELDQESYQRWLDRLGLRPDPEIGLDL